MKRTPGLHRSIRNQWFHDDWHELQRVALPGGRCMNLRRLSEGDPSSMYWRSFDRMRLHFLQLCRKEEKR